MAILRARGRQKGQASAQSFESQPGDSDSNRIGGEFRDEWKQLPDIQRGFHTYVQIAAARDAARVQCLPAVYLFWDTTVDGRQSVEKAWVRQARERFGEEGSRVW